MLITVDKNTVSSIEIEIYEPIKDKPHFVKRIKNRKIKDVLTELNEKLHILLPKHMETLEYKFGDIIDNQLDEEDWPVRSTKKTNCFYQHGTCEGYYCTIRVGKKNLTYAITLYEGQLGAEIVGDIAKYASMLLSC